MPRRARSGTAYNKAPMPPDSDDEGGGEHQVRFQADPASQSPSRMPRRARSGTAYNKAPPPPDSDDDEVDIWTGARKGVQFEDVQAALTHDLFGPGGQAEKKKKGWQRRRSGTAFNRAPPPPEDNEEEYDDVSSSADSTESSDDEDGDQGNTDKGGSSIAAQPSNATQRTLPRVGSRLFNNAFA